MLCESGFTEHRGGVAADEHDSSCFEAMVTVEHETVRLFGNGAEIGGVLAVVFATIFERGQLKRPHLL